MHEISKSLVDPKRSFRASSKKWPSVYLPISVAHDHRFSFVPSAERISLILVCRLSSRFSCHISCPKVFIAVRDDSTTSKSSRKVSPTSQPVRMLMHALEIAHWVTQVNDCAFFSLSLFPLSISICSDDVTIVSRSTGVFEQHDNGEIYLRLTSFDVEPTIKQMKIFATGLLPDPELSKSQHFIVHLLVIVYVPSLDGILHK